jgi:hypothetical protein
LPELRSYKGRYVGSHSSLLLSLSPVPTVFTYSAVIGKDTGLFKLTEMILPQNLTLYCKVENISFMMGDKVFKNIRSESKSILSLCFQAALLSAALFHYGLLAMMSWKL